MTQLQLEQIADAIQRITATHPREHTDFKGRPVFKLEGLEEYFRKFVVSELAQKFPAIDPAPLRIGGLMALLGPIDSRPLPLTIYEELEKCLLGGGLGARPVEDQLSPIVQYIFAYGCERGRIAPSGVARWDDLWPKAWHEMVLVGRGLLRRIQKRLAGTVERFSEDVLENRSAQDVWDELASDAVLLTIKFLEAPPHPIEFEYQNYRSVLQWKPDKGSIYRWFQIVLEGGANAVSKESGHLKANVFDKGLYFPILQARGQLDNGKVAVQKCGNDGCDYSGDYDDALCPTCQGASFLIDYEVRLIVPLVYMAKRFYLCPGPAPHSAHYFINKVYSPLQSNVAVRKRSDIAGVVPEDPTMEKEYLMRRNPKARCATHDMDGSQRPTDAMLVRARYAQSPDLPKFDKDDYENDK